MKILALDSSNQALSVALVEDGRLQAETLLVVKKNHSISLMPVVDFLVARSRPGLLHGSAGGGGDCQDLGLHPQD